jgi:hypothetical protein
VNIDGAVSRIKNAPKIRENDYVRCNGRSKQKTRDETKPAVQEVDVERLHCNLTRSDRCAAEAGKAKVTESDSKFHWKQSVAVVSQEPETGGRVVLERFTLLAQQRPG